jgi:hypothetical protein
MPYLRGAFVMFMPVLGVSTPNVIVFQYNPETLTHAWTQAQTAAAESANPVAVRTMPSETFSFELALDANESIADGGVGGAVAQAAGIGPRLAALEMLQYPTGVDALGGLVRTVSASLGSGPVSLGGGGDTGKRSVPLHRLPVVIFVWGPGRIAPIRVTGLTITERLYDDRLNPTQARAQISIRVLTRNEVAHLDGAAKTVANAALSYSESLRQAGAVANLGNAAESITGMLPV